MGVSVLTALATTGDVDASVNVDEDLDISVNVATDVNIDVDVDIISQQRLHNCCFGSTPLGVVNTG